MGPCLPKKPHTGKRGTESQKFRLVTLNVYYISPACIASMIPREMLQQLGCCLGGVGIECDHRASRVVLDVKIGPYAASGSPSMLTDFRLCM